MKKNNTVKPIFLWMTLFCGLLPVHAAMADGGYQEQGKIGDPNSWLSTEFTDQWGLAAIGAQYAYARGYTGKGINVGVLDEAVTPHVEFADKLRRLSPEDTWNYSDNKPRGQWYTGLIDFGAHGNHVSGTIAANRDGKGIHGVAFDAGLITGKFLQSDYNRTEALIQSNVRVINNSWGVRPPVPKDQWNDLIRWPNGTGKYKQWTLQNIIDDMKPIKDKLEQASQLPTPEINDDNGDGITSTAGLLRAARNDKLVVFAAGNSNHYNQTWLHAGMPYFFPDVLKNYLSVANLTKDKVLNLSSTICGYTASYCISAPGTDIKSSTGNFISKTGGKIDENALNNDELEIDQTTYDTYTGTSMASPHVVGAAAVLMQRFPYMTAGQIADVLKTTATPLTEQPKHDDGLYTSTFSSKDRINEYFGWGMLNLKDAIDGPKMFITEDDIPKQFYIPGSYTETQFVANVPGIGAIVEKDTTVERVCDSIECEYDIWSNDITGHGGLTKIGLGTLELAGKNSTYKGPTLVEAGRLQLNGSITSAVTVQKDATLSGNGTVGSLTFNEGSRYLVNVSPNTNALSNRIYSNGEATLNGGAVEVMLENRDNLLAKTEVRSLLGQQYNILQANKLNGQFATVTPNYLFIGTKLSHQDDRVMLDINRTQKFADVANTANQRAVAGAADNLALGHPVFESILMLDTKEQAQQAFQQLSSGQIHADMAAAQINSSRYLRDTLNTRLRQSNGGVTSQDIKTDQNGVWAQITSNWQRADNRSDIDGYRMSDYGVLLGADKELANDWRVGVATGYTRSSLRGSGNTKASSNNFHLAMYGSKQIDALALRTGAAYSWHRFDTERSVAYSNQFDNLKAKYNAYTGQLFTEAAYGITTSALNMEPFANLSYVNFRNDGINEHGGAAALHGKKQSKNATYSTLGLRVDQQWQVKDKLAVGVYGELGWQHQFGKVARDRKLMFSNSNADFTINSVAAARNAAVVKAGTTLNLNENTKFSLGYNGVLSSGHKDNGVALNVNWNF
ncbi:MAG: autotransporter outer membrane beta-barrel domain-containing protein [Enterobacteriaceae bacterium]|jgi:subtilase-type serine protease|nr:autotransporter outer membrane beta-barrel domain-containing protein [Enterobacteriaceae bacterium]